MENDLDFKVGQRIIGQGGRNVKQIMARATRGSKDANHDLKIRLRGRGSGFKEGRGNNKHESTREPLQ